MHMTRHALILCIGCGSAAPLGTLWSPHQRRLSTASLPLRWPWSAHHTWQDLAGACLQAGHGLTCGCCCVEQAAGADPRALASPLLQKFDPCLQPDSTCQPCDAGNPKGQQEGTSIGDALVNYTWLMLTYDCS